MVEMLSMTTIDKKLFDTLNGGYFRKSFDGFNIYIVDLYCEDKELVVEEMKKVERNAKEW